MIGYGKPCHEEGRRTCAKTCDIFEVEILIQATNYRKGKSKVCFYIAQYPARYIAQSALHLCLHFNPWQTCSFRHQLDFSGKHTGHAAITREDYSLTFRNFETIVISKRQYEAIIYEPYLALWNFGKLLCILRPTLL